MGSIDSVQKKVQAKSYFNHLSREASYVRILDTPHVWGQGFGAAIMPTALERTREYERVVAEIVQKSRYRCDVASLNSPDPDWGRVILEAMDVSLSERLGRTRPTQFRFLFGQTPLSIYTGTPANYVDFQGALIRMVRSRSHLWETMPEIWMGRFYRLREGILAGFLNRIGEMFSSISSGIMSDGDVEEDGEFTKMTWNHAKIIASDGAEALVGGHNMNMDLFTSYPPVHDVSAVVHGVAAHGAQLYLNKMWQCKTDLLTKEYLDVETLRWKNGDDDRAPARKPTDPLEGVEAAAYMGDCRRRLARVHGQARGPILGGGIVPELVEEEELDEAAQIRADDMQTLVDLGKHVFEERRMYNSYDKLQDYKKATRILSVGKYWKGPDMGRDFQKGSELMKEDLIKGARRILRMSQMDLVSAWKKKWSSHVVCHWIMDALLANGALTVQVVVSPLDAGAGAEGDQYSFGSGAGRTFDLIKYYMTHKVGDDTVLPGAAERERALERLHIAPFYFTHIDEELIEGVTYQWPNLPPKGYTATLKQLPLAESPPKKGIIGSAVTSVIKASGLKAKVPSAPGNHAKVMIVDDESYVVGSDNLYPGFLSEFNYLVEGKAAVDELLGSYWHPLWRYSGLHCVNPACTLGRQACRDRGIPLAPHL